MFGQALLEKIVILPSRSQDEAVQLFNNLTGSTFEKGWVSLQSKRVQKNIDRRTSPSIITITKGNESNNNKNSNNSITKSSTLPKPSMFLWGRANCNSVDVRNSRPNFFGGKRKGG